MNTDRFSEHRDTILDATQADTERRILREEIMAEIEQQREQPTMNIDELKAAVAEVMEKTGESYVFARVEWGGWKDCANEATFSVYSRGRHHDASTLQEAIAKAVDYSPQKQKLEKAARLRAEAEQLEKEANANS